MSNQRKMLNLSPLPETYLPFLSPSAASALTSIKAKVKDLETQCSAYPSVPSSIPEFLDTKILFLENRAEYLQKYKLAVTAMKVDENTPERAFLAERSELEEAECAAAEESVAIKAGRKIVHEDIKDGVQAGNILEDAYAAAMAGRVRVATGSQSALRFNGSKFKAEVLKYYDATNMDPESGKRSWCHLLGWWQAPYVRATHIVPKSLEEDSASFLFGGEVKPATDVRNALLLHRSLEKRLDSGDIAIVPVPGNDNMWKCLVTRKEKLGLVVCSNNIRLRDIHGRQLQFRSENRPAKRYLFFRYLMTYLRHKAEGNLEWAESVETNFAGWLTPGRYLRKSTLLALAKKFTGEDLPKEMLEVTEALTFHDDDELLPPRDLEETTRLEKAVVNLRAVALTPRALYDDDTDEQDDDEEEWDDDVV